MRFFSFGYEERREAGKGRKSSKLLSEVSALRRRFALNAPKTGTQSQLQASTLCIKTHLTHTKERERERKSWFWLRQIDNIVYGTEQKRRDQILFIYLQWFLSLQWRIEITYLSGIEYERLKKFCMIGFFFFSFC